MRKTVAGLFVVALLLTDARWSLASVERIGVCEDRSDGVCSASGSVRHPRRLTMTLRSRPDGDGFQNFRVVWATVCFKWSERERKRGVFRDQSPIKRQLPMAYWRPGRCKVDVHTYAAFSGGHTKLALRARI